MASPPLKYLNITDSDWNHRIYDFKVIN